ncbi:MAG TPA: hypothetical protein VFF67_09040 [Thermoplasmata archaeon]|nr:hypothetical protein [Thermoplasmata archaeon]
MAMASSSAAWVAGEPSIATTMCANGAAAPAVAASPALAVAAEREVGFGRVLEAAPVR